MKNKTKHISQGLKKYLLNKNDKKILNCMDQKYI